MLKNLPYSTLTQNRRAYEIMLLRDQYQNTFTAIATEYGMTCSRVVQIYRNIKRNQKQLYINHLSIILGHENNSQMRELYDNAYLSYQNCDYAYAYLEKKYPIILTEFRDGEPGMPKSFLKNLPPFRPNLSKKTISLIIKMREIEGLPYSAISKKLHITTEKAKYTYDCFYHAKVLELIKKLQAHAETEEEKYNILYYYFKHYSSSKKRYDALTQENL